VGDDELVGGDVVGREDVADRQLDALARQRLAVQHQHVAARLRPSQQIARGVHRSLGRPLRPPNACQLGRVLHAPAGGERLAVGDELEAFGAQKVGELEREPPGTTALAIPTTRQARSAT
jgi:hypothetical protein